jgi:hypothetical protein
VHGPCGHAREESKPDLGPICNEEWATKVYPGHVEGPYEVDPVGWERGFLFAAFSRDETRTLAALPNDTCHRPLAAKNPYSAPAQLGDDDSRARVRRTLVLVLDQLLHGSARCEDDWMHLFLAQMF